jgi:hypothetical protein
VSGFKGLQYICGCFGSKDILGSVYGNGKENGRILTDKEYYVTVKKPTITQTIRLHRLCWFGHVQSMEGNRIPQNSIVYEFGSTRLRHRTRNRWQDEVREDGSMVCGEEWQEKVYNREERKKLLRTARNRHILCMPVERTHKMKIKNINALLLNTKHIMCQFISCL